MFYFITYHWRKQGGEGWNIDREITKKNPFKWEVDANRCCEDSKYTYKVLFFSEITKADYVKYRDELI